MKKILFALLAFLALQLSVLAATEADARSFFQSYVNAANSYNSKLLDFYAPDAKITRVVEDKKSKVKKTVTIPMPEYAKQLRHGQTAARIARYKNTYTNIAVSKDGENFVLTATRTPGSDKVGLPSRFVIGENSAGALKIKEEMMETKVQTFLKYAK